MSRASISRSVRQPRADLRAMMGDGLAFSFMVGIGESYIAPFALALGLGDVTAGLIATLPMLAGALFQLVTPAAVGWLGSHKRWVVLCAFLQAASFVPLIAGALAGSMEVGLLYFAVALYWGLGMSTGPAWNTWVETIVPPSIRAGYFAQRARWSQATLLVGLAVGGALLELGRRIDWTVAIYAIVFGLALLARGISATFLSRQSEPKPVPLGETSLSPRAIREHLRHGGHGRLLAFLLVFQSSVWIAAPYFAPYMLGPLGLDLVSFSVLTGTAFVSRVVALPALGRYAHRAGTRRLLWFGSVGIVPLPALWLVSDSLPWLLAIQLLSGVMWAAFELGTMLSFFEQIPHHARTSVLSLYNLASAIAIVTGGGIGGLVLSQGGGFRGGYGVLLVVSTLARFASLTMLRGAANVTPSSGTPPTMRTLSVRPSAGAVQRPIVATLEEEGGGDEQP